MIMKVMAHSSTLKLLSKIDIFRMDLGKNLYGEKKDGGIPNQKFKIRDKFIKYYNNATNRIIYKYGDIGTLEFFDDPLLDSTEMVIYKNDSFYDTHVDLDKLYIEPRKYLSFILENIDKTDSEKQTFDNHKIEEIEDNSTIKGGDKMSTDEYVNAMIEKRNRLNNE